MTRAVTTLLRPRREPVHVDLYLPARQRLTIEQGELMTDHLIFRYGPEHQPEITFRAVSSGCAGGANTLAEARAS